MATSTRDLHKQKQKQHKSARSRPRSSLACLSCRQKKIKCNVQALGANASCSACQSSNFNCIVVPNGDRRKHGSKDHITALQARLDSIEALVGRYSVNADDSLQPYHIDDLSPSEASADLTTTNGVDAVEEPEANVSASESIPALPSKGDQDHEPHTQPPPYVPPATFYKPAQPRDHAVPERPIAARSQSSDQRSDATTPGLHRGGSSLRERRTSTIDEVRPTLDADSSPGMVRYYGPTTQLYIQSSSDADSGSRTSAKSASTVDFILDMDSPQLRNSLIQLSWGYYSRSVSVVDERLFMLHRERQQRSQYYSSFLECALLACATRMRTSQGMKRLGRAYADRAKQELIHELENPIIATLQGLLLLSEFEATSARDRLGWIYSGIACRLLFDLGLHEDCSKLVTSGVLDDADAKLRHELFLSSFVHDCLWALYLGRPCCIPLASVKQHTTLDVPVTLRCWVELGCYIAELTEMLNGFGSVVIDEEAIRRLHHLSSRIDTTYKKLPAPFSPHDVSALHETAYGLNMQFCGIQIVLHRAVIKALCTDEGLHTQDPRISRSRRVMDENAVVICQLVLAYREIFGVENFITVMLDNMYIAVGALIAHVLRPPSEGSSTIADPMSHLRVICETFDDLQKHYVVAEKMRRTLSTVTQNTILARTFNSNSSTDSFASSHASSHAAFAGPSSLADPIVPPPNGSWGSMEALLNDNFFLGHGNMFDDTFAASYDLDHSMLL